jgi:hypothetical protein
MAKAATAWVQLTLDDQADVTGTRTVVDVASGDIGFS